MWTGWPLLESNGGSDNPLISCLFPYEGEVLGCRHRCLESTHPDAYHRSSRAIDLLHAPFGRREGALEGHDVRPVVGKGPKVEGGDRSRTKTIHHLGEWPQGPPPCRMQDRPHSVHGPRLTLGEPRLPVGQKESRLRKVGAPTRGALEDLRHKASAPCQVEFIDEFGDVPVIESQVRLHSMVRRPEHKTLGLGPTPERERGGVFDADVPRKTVNAAMPMTPSATATVLRFIIPRF